MMLHQLINFSRKLGVAILALIVVILGPAGAAIFVVGRAIATITTNMLVKIGFNRVFLLIGSSNDFCEGNRTPAHLVSNIVAASAMIFTVIKIANYFGF